MRFILENIEKLGLTLPECPKPLAAYSPARRSGHFIFIAGQLPLHEGNMPQGAVPDAVSTEEAVQAAAQCFLNGLAAALSVTKEDEHLALMQMQGFVQSAPGFEDQPKILNGASELALKILGEEGHHARTAVGVSSLPKNAPVEISFVFHAEKEAEPDPKFEGRYNWL